MVVGLGEADRYLPIALGELKRLCDDAVICLNNADSKTYEMVQQSGFRHYNDDREWGLYQPLIKEKLLGHVGELAPDWVVAIDADEQFDQSFDRAHLERLASQQHRAWYVFIVNLWDEGYRPELSFWNIRLFAFPKDPSDRHFEHKALHCGIAPKSCYHVGAYAPILLLHHGLRDRADRERKRERYRKYDKTRKFTTPAYYDALEKETEAKAFNIDTLREAVKKEVSTYKQEKPKSMTFLKSRKFVMFQRDDGSVIDVPFENAEADKKRHPTWKVIQEIVPGVNSSTDAHVPPPVIPDPLQCSFCGEISKTEQGLKAHKTRRHKV